MSQSSPASRSPSTPRTTRRADPTASETDHPRKVLLGETELRTQLQHSLETLAAELAAGKSERLQQYLDFAARFHHYSRANQWLIAAQMPGATRVGSYKHWQEEGYQVARGQTGIRILAPSTRKQHNDETGEDERKVVGFVAVSVFDVSQLTEDQRPPEFFTPLEGDQEALYERLKAAATSDGFTVLESPETRGAEGYSQGTQLVTRTGLPSTNRALTLIHEYSHGLLHQQMTPLALRRGISLSVMECHAEATAYVVGAHFGLPTPFSADYLLQWGNSPETLRAELDTVIGVASHIITAVHAQQPGADQLHDAAEPSALP